MESINKERVLSNIILFNWRNGQHRVSKYKQIFKQRSKDLFR